MLRSILRSRRPRAGAPDRSRWLLRVALPLVLAAPLQAQPQAAIVTGRVTSDMGQPLFGANVYITELNLSVATNESGTYNLIIPGARVAGQTVQLRVRSVGYAPQTRAITVAAGTQTVDFQLRLDAVRLGEVVVTGVTGATERAKVPFSVTRIDSTLMPVVGTNPLSQLQGKVAGANITGSSGRPGAQPSVLLRGPTSINASGRGQDPLYIVDGVVLQGGLPDLNSNDIESVEVVKGAAAASLYGSRAGAGVIQITTKRGGGADGVRFTARSEYGFGDVERDFGIARSHAYLTDETGTRFCVLDAVGSGQTCSRTIDYAREAARINNAPGDFALAAPSLPVDPGSVTSGNILRQAFLTNRWPGRTFNAVDQVVDPKPTTMNDFSMQGRFGSTSFFSSVHYTEQGGAIAGLKGYDRVGGRINLAQAINDQWDVQVTSYFSRSAQDGLDQEDGGRSFFRLTRVPAIVDITQRDTLGRLYIRPNLAAGGVQNENPLYWLENQKRQDVRYRYLGGSTVRYTPIEWFDVEGNFSIDRLNWNARQFRNRGFRTTNSDANTNNGFLFNATTNTQSLNGSLGGTVRRQFGSDLATRFNLRALFEQQDLDFRNLQGTQLRVSDVTSAPNITAQQQLNSGQQSTRQMSFSGGANFDFRDRYILDFLVRRDGSSRFGTDNRWQTYGRGSASWLVAREPWFPSEQISQMTLRASIGTAGNTPRWDAQYETYQILSGGQLNPVTLGNRNLRPEVITEVEVGGDLELYEAVGLGVTYARSQARNQILPVPLSFSSGFQTQWQNAGTMENRTWEASLSVPFIRRPDLNWSGRVNYTSNRATITRLDVPPFTIGTDLQATTNIIRIEEGIRYGTFYGRKFLTSCGELPAQFQGQCGAGSSAFQRNDEGYLVWVGEGNNPGMGISDNLWNTFLPAAQSPWGVEASWGMPIVLRDVNPLDPNAPGSARIVPLGHALPDWQLGFAQNFSWRRITGYALVDGAFGQSVWNQGRHWSYLDFLSQDVDQAGKSIENAKPIGYYYRAPRPDNNNGIGGFYDILGPNNRFVEDASYMKLREVSLGYRIGPVGGAGDWSLSLIGRNLKTWTDYSGFDPEVGVTSGSLVTGNGAFDPTLGSGSGSGAVNAIDAFTFPNLRTFTFVLSTSF